MPRTTTGTAITGHGVWHPPTVLENEELCVAFNEYIRREKAKNPASELKESSPEFIVKASGILKRYVQDKTGLLDPERMCPNIPDRPEEQLSYQAEYAVNAAKLALAAAGRTGEDVDLVVLGASNLQRLYPAIAIEVQNALGARGYGFDISLGCSAATGATQLACQAVRLGQAPVQLFPQFGRPREAGLVGDPVDADAVEVGEHDPQQQGLPRPLRSDDAVQR